MKHNLRCHRISDYSDYSDSDFGPFLAPGGHLPALQAQSSLRPQELQARHPQIRQCKQRHQLRRVLGKTLVAHLGESKLAFDDSERVLHLGAHTGLHLLSLVQQIAPWRVLIQWPALA